LPPKLIESRGEVPIESATTADTSASKGRLKGVRSRGDGPAVQIVIFLFVIGVFFEYHPRGKSI
jgi:hypothetical protein